MRTIRVLAILTLAGAAAFSQSYPSAWNYADPSANVLLGIDWTRLRQSPFAAMAKQKAEMADLNFLDQASQMLLAVTLDKETIRDKKQPRGLMILCGNFDLQAVRRVAAAKQMRAFTYHSVPLMTERGKSGDEDGTLGLVGEQTLLFGDRRSVMEAIGRNASGAPRVFNAALASAGKLAATQDLWIIAHDFANQLSDKMSGPFQPGRDITAIEVGVSLHDGIEAEAALTAKSDVSAERLATMLESFKPQLPPELQSFGVASKENVVHLALSIDQEHLMAMIGQFTQRALAKAMPAKPAAAEPAPPPEKMTIKIYGLDGGTREIPYPTRD